MLDSAYEPPHVSVCFRTPVKPPYWASPLRWWVTDLFTTEQPSHICATYRCSFNLIWHWQSERTVVSYWSMRLKKEWIYTLCLAWHIAFRVLQLSYICQYKNCRVIYHVQSNNQYLYTEKSSNVHSNLTSPPTVPGSMCMAYGCPGVFVWECMCLASRGVLYLRHLQLT